MAYVRLIQRWPDHSETEIEIGTYDGAAYPDQAAELVARTLDLWRATCMGGEA